MRISEAQALIRETYHERDSERGAPLTALHLVEELGELLEAIRRGSEEDIRAEAADVFAWLLSTLDLLGVDLESAFVERYGSGCPRCGFKPCRCPPLQVGRWSGGVSDR
ncbi:MAG: MazG nucleotide pyrophosphohydrolase domain-containing protein [Candidatus Korarchaeota archaeon]|nr:MazG nucleotide pyrophosphohydrolase domain-containing protein [Candidatus Korarchaeota archaeon]